jgi:ABC-type branched-subunit amino acid transport system substrate-binding protein
MRKVFGIGCSSAVLAAVVACGGGGEAAVQAPGVSGDTIYVGALVPLSDAVAVIGKPVLAGLNTYFEALNAAGGIGGKYKVKVLAEDITYANPSSGSQKYQKIKGQVTMFASIIGTDQINGVLPLLSEDSILALPTTFDAEWVRNPNLLPWGVPYQLQAINGVGYAITDGGYAGKPVCTMTLATGYGEAAVEGVDYMAKEMNFTVAAKATFKQDDQDFVAPVTQLKNANCAVIMMASLPSVTGKVLGAAAQLGYAPRWILTSPSYHHALAASPLKDYLAKTTWISWDGALYADSTTPAMRAFAAAQQKYAPDQTPDLFYVAGYVMGYPVRATLEKAVASGNLGRSGIMAGAAAVPTLNTDGILSEWTYGAAAQRNPPRSGTIFKIDPGVPLSLGIEKQGVSVPAAASFTFK